MLLTVRTAAVATLAFSALSIGACGSSDKPDSSAAFGKAYAAQSAKVRSIGDGVVAAISGAGRQTAGQIAVTFGALATRTHATADGVGALEAPAAVKTDVADLQRALGRAADDLDAIVAAAKSGDATAARKASQALVDDSAPIRNARAAVDRSLGK